MTGERVQEAVDVGRIFFRVIGRHEGTTLRAVRAAVHDARTAWKKTYVSE